MALEDGQEFAHAGNRDDLVHRVVGFEPVPERPDHRVAGHRADRRHPQPGPDMTPTSVDLGGARGCPALLGEGGDPDQRNQRLGVEGPEFVEFGQQQMGRDPANAWNRAENLPAPLQHGIGVDQGGDLNRQVRDLALEKGDVTGNGCQGFRISRLATALLGGRSPSAGDDA